MAATGDQLSSAPAVPLPETTDTPRPPPALRWLLLAAALVLAVLPAVLAAHHAIDQGWRPIADDSRLAVDAASFASGHPPLLGAHSTTLENATHIQPVHHLGPSETWLLGVTQLVWPGSRSMVVTVAALAAAASAVIVLAARRMAGDWAALVAGAVVGTVAARLGAPILADIWNPYVPILPLAAAVTAAWAAFLTRWRAGLPLAVFFGTIAVQAHVTHAPLLAAALVPLLVAWLLARRARRSGGEGASPAGSAAVRSSPDGASSPAGRGRLHLTAGVVAVVIGVVLWAPSALSELSAGPSNLVNLWRAATTDTGESALGLGYAFRVFNRVVGWPPPLGPPVIGGTAWAAPQGVSLAGAGRCLLTMVPVLAMLAWGIWRRDRLTWLLAGSVVTVDAVAIALLKMSTFSSGIATYQTRWLWSLATLHWGAVGIGLVHMVHVVRRRTADGRSRERRLLAGSAAALAAVLACSSLVTTVRPATEAAVQLPPDQHNRMVAVAELQSQLHRNRNLRGPLIIGSYPANTSTTAVGFELAGALIVDGVDVKLSSSDRSTRRFFGGRYEAQPGDRGDSLVVTHPDVDAVMRARGYHRIAATSLLTSREQRRLRQLTDRIGRRLSSGGLRWTKYGFLLHFGQARPDPDALLQGNVLAVAMYSGQLSGPLPSASDVRTFTGLQRKLQPYLSFVVWRRSGPTG